MDMILVDCMRTVARTVSLAPSELLNYFLACSATFVGKVEAFGNERCRRTLADRRHTAYHQSASTAVLVVELVRIP